MGLRGVRGEEQVKVKATVLLISGCQDNQVAADGATNGLFTGTLKKVWRNGKFKGNYRHFRDSIVAKMPISQVPAYFVHGAVNREFENEHPFSIVPPKPAPARKVPATRTRSGRTRSAGTRSVTPLKFVLRGDGQLRE